MTAEQALLLILIANGSPILVSRLARHRAGVPVDFGYHWVDGRPLFGSNKTWRGLLTALALTGTAALVLGLPCHWGIGMAAAAMLGDLLSSFLKRRAGLTPSSQCWGLDQIPEALLPALVAYYWFALEGWAVVWVTLLFLLLSTLLSRILYVLGIRKRPY